MQDKGSSAKRIAIYGMLIAAAMVLSYLESLLPPLGAVPGIKIGITNVVVLLAMYRLDNRAGFYVNLIRILLVGFCFGNGAGIIYSLSGGALSFLVMLLLKRFGFAKMTVSIMGGVFHNVGQVIAAIIILKSPEALFYYMLLLWFSGIISGAIVGFISGICIDRLGSAYKTKL